MIQSAIASSMASLIVSPRVIASILNFTQRSRSTLYNVTVTLSRTVVNGADDPLELVNWYPHLHGQDNEGIFEGYLC